MSATFKDSTGKEWPVEITVGRLKRVRTSTGVELGKILTDQAKLNSLLYEDAESFVNVLYILTGADIDPETYCDRFNAETLEAARIALVEAVANFTQPPAISKVFAENWRAMMDAKMEAVAVKVKTELDRLTLSEPAMNSPASSASTQAA